VIDSPGRVTTPQYDKLTAGLKGWDSAAGQKQLDYVWHYDDRGLIASESFVSDRQAVAKTYVYDDAEFLTTETSQILLKKS